MTPLIIDSGQLAALRELAALHPVDMADMLERIKRPDEKIAHLAQMTRQTIYLPMGFYVTFSIEDNHPCGTCRHMSMSVENEGRVPNASATWLVAEELGFWGTLHDCHVYPEELAENTVAINVVQPLNPP